MLAIAILPTFFPFFVCLFVCEYLDTNSNCVFVYFSVCQSVSFLIKQLLCSYGLVVLFLFLNFYVFLTIALIFLHYFVSIAYFQEDFIPVTSLSYDVNHGNGTKILLCLIEKYLKIFVSSVYLSK